MLSEKVSEGGDSAPDSSHAGGAEFAVMNVDRHPDLRLRSAGDGRGDRSSPSITSRNSLTSISPPGEESGAAEWRIGLLRDMDLVDRIVARDWRDTCR